MGKPVLDSHCRARGLDIQRLRDNVTYPRVLGQYQFLDTLKGYESSSIGCQW
jgi:hypothetical protein